MLVCLYIYLYIYMYVCMYVCICIDLMRKVFANGPGDRVSTPGRVIPKTLKMVLNVALLNIHHYKLRIKSKVEQSRECGCDLPYTLV